MKSLELKIVERCIRKQLLEKGNQLYRKYAYKIGYGLKCDKCSGYTIVYKKSCYIEDKE